MADNTTLNAGSGGDTVAMDDIAGVKYQRVKPCHGADGAATDASAAAPFPVDANFARQVALGNITGYALRKLYGSAALTSGPKIVESGTIAFPTAARTHQVKSDSTDDASAGTGARTVVIEGLDDSYDEQSETVTLNGTTNVATANTYLRINRMYVATAGSGEVNAGNITATANTDLTVTCRIDTGYADNQTHSTRYTVPNGKTALVLKWWGNLFITDGDIGGRAEFWLRVRELNGAWRNILREYVAAYGAAAFEHHFDYPVNLPAKTDLYVRGDDLDSAVMQGNAGLELLIVTD